jgi:hypothetical protein
MSASVSKTKLLSELEDTPQGVLLWAAPAFAPTAPAAAFGILHHPGERACTIEDMHQAIEDEVLARHARGRY